MLLSLSALAALCVSPFIFVRLANDDWEVALLNTVITVVMVCFFSFVYISRKVDVARFYMSTFLMAVIIVDVMIKGSAVLYWYYPCVIATYYLTSFRTAFFIGIVSIMLLMVVVYSSVPSIEFFTILITSLLLNVFALLIFRSNQKIATQLKKLATIDALTLAGNRRALENQLYELASQHQRSPFPLCLIIFDLDHFKLVNDQYGHVAGDDILTGICQLVRDNTRACENLYRYGGEEFIITPLQSTLSEAEIVAQKLRQLIEEHTFGTNIKITVSIGVAQYEADEQPQKWISRADTALYLAKNAGRNRVMLAQ